MPPVKRERFNAKARQSSVGSSHKRRKKGKIARPEGNSESIAEEGSNALLIDPEVESARRHAEQKRKELLNSNDAGSASQPISSKKRKRLDAYITRQLKKENRQRLMADLANSSAQVEDRSTLMTAATLGTGKVLTGQERLQHDAAKEERVQQRRRGRGVNGYSVHGANESDTEGDYSDVIDEVAEDKGTQDTDDARERRLAAARALFTDKDPAKEKTDTEAIRKSLQREEELTPSAPLLGSALAVGPDGKPFMPTMKKRRKPRRRKGGMKTAWGRLREEEESSSEESSFNSSDSEVDGASSPRASSPASGSTSSGKGLLHVNGASSQEQELTDMSASSLGDDSDSHASDSTDEEEKAVLEEAMRRRGMLGDPDRPVPDFDASDAQDEMTEDYCIEGHVSEGESLPFAFFDEEAKSTVGDGDAPADDSESDESDEGSEEYRYEQSRRRGLAQTNKSSGFKDWANNALGIVQREDASEDEGVYRGPEPVAGLISKVSDLMDGTIRGPLGEEEIAMQDRSAFAQKYYEEVGKRSADGKASSDRIEVHRDASIEEARMMLPILAEEERIVRTIMENMVTVLCGETGSGKTTQVPQFLYEAGFGSAGSSNPGMIGITQPRRVAALSMAARVGKELNVSSSIVSYQIRYDVTVNLSTKIKFMTDGVLLRELANDFLLTKYSAIIIDEAHERSVNTDVLIGVLSRIVKLRGKKWIEGQGWPLRLVIMSATLRVEDFIANARLFDTIPPVIEIDARQYPVVTHFNRRTSHDYVTESVKKASKIHARLPAGGILIFLTGQAEISVVCRKLEKRYGKRAIQERLRRNKSRAYRADEEEEVKRQDKVALAARYGDVEAEEIDLSTKTQDDVDLALDVDDGRVDIQDADALDSDSEEEGQDHDADLPAELRDDTDIAMHILPLYSLLPSDQQMRVFETPPANTRLVVVATNVAETSLTIPGITYVVDCGRSKERKYDPTTNIQTFEVGFISKASANQRAGRAGRTGPGHCYRLYSSNVYEEHFHAFAQPEILRTPVDNLVLMMKAINIDNVANFPFPTPPDRESLQRAEKLLLRLGALQVDPTVKKGSTHLKVTELGRLMSLFPLSSRLSKLLVQGHQFDCLPFVIALVAALSVGDPFVKEQSLHDDHISHEDDDTVQAEEVDLPIEARHLHNQAELEKEKRKAKRSSYFRTLNQFAALGGAMSDPLRLLNAVGAYEHAGGTLRFCQDHYLVPKAMQEIHKLRAQLSSMVQANAEPGYDWSRLNDPKFSSPPTEKQLIILRQFLAAAFIDQVAIRADLVPESAARVPMLQITSSSSDHHIAKQFQHQIRNGAKMKSTRDVAYLAAGVPAEACFIHNSSVLYHQSPPEWIVFTEVFRGRNRGDLLDVAGKNWLKGITKINPNWIHKLGKSLCSFGKTIEVDPQDSRSKLIEAAKELKRRHADATSSSNRGEKQVFVVPTYGNGPAFDLNERSSHLGWELPAVAARQKLVGGKWITELL